MTVAPAPPRRVLPILVMAQFMGTSLWFAVNAVMPDLQRELGWPGQALGTLTAGVQGGFIAGTLVFALLAVADRFPPRRVFLCCSLAGAGCTLGAWLMVRDFHALMAWRVATGFFLAGIYPVGMKIASQWYPKGLGTVLGLLVGALVLGSASAHALRGLAAALPWPSVMLGVALLAATGGVLLHVGLPEPPATPHRGAGSGVHLRSLGALWSDARLRASVLGYFGHMWELYTVWVLVPVILAARLDGAALSFASFAVLGAGALGCIGGGYAARRLGSARVAAAQLATSGLCCLAAPWLLGAPDGAFALWLLLWGLTVSGDSPQLSALTAANAPPPSVGSVLTLVNCIGFAISALSIELFVRLAQVHALSLLLPALALGPIVGLWALRPLLADRPLRGPPERHP